MLTYTEARLNMETGDALMVKATGMISRLIRAVTGESINHVAMVIRQPSGVFVVEMREGKGWLFSPASQWLPRQHNKVVLWGRAPSAVRGDPCVAIKAMSHRGEPYSYWTLITVWVGQFTNKKHRGNLVCSTFVQKVWLDCGYKMFNKLADPGDFMEHAEDINHIV